MGNTLQNEIEVMEFRIGELVKSTGVFNRPFMDRWKSERVLSGAWHERVWLEIYRQVTQSYENVRSIPKQ